MEMNNQQVRKLKKAKKKLFSKASLRTKEVLLKYEELGSIKRTIETRTVYIQVINDVLNRIKWLLTKSEKQSSLARK